MILVALDAIADAPRALVARVAAHLHLPPPALTDLADPLASLPPEAASDGVRLLDLEANATGPASVHATTPPHAHAVDALASLARRNLVTSVITMRDTSAGARWLAAHGLGTLGVARFASGSFAATHAAIIQYARERRARLLIEHDPRVAHAVAEAGYPVILLDLPYNRALAHPLVLRAYDWRGIHGLLLALPIDRRKDRRGF